MKKSISFLISSILFFTLHSGVSLDSTVHTPTGLKKVGMLNIGDEVISFSEKGSFEKSRITVIQDIQEEVFEIIVSGNQSLLVSGDQKFFDCSQAQWVKASQLQKGDFLEQCNCGSAEILSIKKIQNKKVVRDITVDKNHTFFISDSAILTHNFFVEITILSWGGGLAMTWFEGVTIAGLATALAGMVAKEALVKKVQEVSGNDIRVVVEAADRVCQGVVKNLAKTVENPGAYPQRNTVEIIHLNESCNEIRSSIICPGREISEPVLIVHPGPDILQPEKLFPIGYDTSKPRPVVRPGPEIIFPQKGSTISTDPVIPYSRPIIFTKTYQDILDECRPGKVTGKSQQHNHHGGYSDAKKHFDDLAVSNIVDKGGGFFTGVMSNGWDINIRPAGSDHPKKPGGGLPTLEIQIPGIKQKIKIRYDQAMKGENGS